MQTYQVEYDLWKEKLKAPATKRVYHNKRPRINTLPTDLHFINKRRLNIKYVTNKSHSRYGTMINTQTAYSIAP